MNREPKRQFRALSIVIALLGWALCPHAVAEVPAVPAAPIMDRVAAVVEGRILTLSQLKFEARVALIQGGDLGAVGRPLDQAALRNGLEWAVGQRLQESEADRLKAFTIETSELEASMEGFESRVGGADALRSFLRAQEVDPAGLARVLERSLRAERMLDSKVRLRAQVTEAEVRGAFAAGLGGPQLAGSYEQVRGPLRERLFRERYHQLAKAELGRMRERADIRWVAPFAASNAGLETAP